MRELIWRRAPAAVRGGRSFPVGGEEHGQHLIGSLLGDKVADAGNDRALNFVRGQLERVADGLARACLAADRQDGHGQRPVLALLVLRDAS